MPKLSSSAARRRPRDRQAGFSLIELMISVTIGLVILASLVGVLSTNSGASKTNDRTSELMTNGRFALDSMKEEIRQAGFRGYTFAEPSTPSPWVAPAAGCAGTEAGASPGAFISNIRQSVWGSNNSNPFLANCIPSSIYTPAADDTINDVIVVRRVSGEPTAAASLVAGSVYFYSAYERGQVYRSTASPVTPPSFAGPPTPLASFAVQTYVYYISPFTTSAAESPKVPALYRVALQADGSMARELVASGIERMQIQYGRLTTVPNTQYVDTMAGSSSAPSVTDWDAVNSVRIWLLARNATAEPGYVNATTYTMGDQPYTVNDGFRRQLFTTVVQLRNFN
jgi:type IV pilus assembly protein PilW